MAPPSGPFGSMLMSWAERSVSICSMIAKLTFGYRCNFLNSSTVQSIYAKFKGQKQALKYNFTEKTNHAQQMARYWETRVN